MEGVFLIGHVEFFQRARGGWGGKGSFGERLPRLRTMPPDAIRGRSDTGIRSLICFFTPTEGDSQR